MFYKLNKLSEYFALARRYDKSSGFPLMRTFFRILYARWRYNLPARVFGTFDLMNQPLSSLRELIRGDERHNLLSAWAPQEWRFLEEDKLAFLQRCRQSAIPACPAMGVITDTDSPLAESLDLPIARTAEETERLIAQLGEIDGILKRIDGGKGSGIYSIEVRKGVLCPRQEYGNAKQLFAWLRSKQHRFYWMIQPKLRPHPDLLNLMPGPGLGTIRIISFRNTSDRITLKWPILKVPASGAIIDNWNDGGSGTIMVEVDVKTGILGPAAGKSSSDSPVERFETHPASGEQITGRHLPCWDELCRLVKNGATAFKELPALGWDVAITPDGPVLIEANWDFGLDMAQTMLGSGLRSQLMLSIEEMSS